MHELTSEFYDQLHTETDLPLAAARYDRLFTRVAKVVRDHGSRSILEVGCGSGFLAQKLLHDYAGDYRGFDFSSIAIRNAGRRTGRPELFFVGNALDPAIFTGDYDTIVCTEVLEHIEADLDAVRLWRHGTWCVCTVPNFEADGHVRFFNTSREVAARYGQLINIKEITKTARPLMPDRRLRTYLRNLRWSRNNPSELLGFLGIQTFSRLGGWFLFYGTKTAGGP
jgi:2-polyprenyl-3-methyl-5-hydroxy-6-metoxy-1,4-benzoquinol methylase